MNINNSDTEFNARDLIDESGDVDNLRELNQRHEKYADELHKIKQMFM